MPSLPALARTLVLAALAASCLISGPAHAATTTVSYGSDPLQRLRVYPGHGPTVLLIHGGCWRRSTPSAAEESFAQQVQRDTGWTVVTMGYRVVGLRAATEPGDVFNAVRTIERGGHGFNPRDVALWGESAGGNLALLTAYKDRFTYPLRAVASVSGPTEMTQMFSAGAQTVLGCVSEYESSTPVVNAARYAATSPDHVVPAHAPPTYLANAASDPFVPARQAQELAATLRNKGVRTVADIVANESDHALLLESDRYRPGGVTVRQRAESFLATFLR